MEITHNPARFVEEAHLPADSGLVDDKYRVIKTADLDRLPHDLGVSAQFVENVRGWVEELSVDTFVFVLRPDRDYHARVALVAYAESVRHFDPSLADDLHQVLGLLDVPEPGAPD